MKMAEKKWRMRACDEECEATLREALKVHPVLCRLLVQRGIRTFEDARIFFRTNLLHLHDPFLMKGMPEAVQRIAVAIQNGEKILIYGDYDVDGTTAVAVVYRFFKKLYEHIEYYIPHRFAEGYGVSRKGIDHAISGGFKLMITLDCGIKSAVLIKLAADHGIDTIVCDHHLPGHELPPAVAILNPKQESCPYPYKELCGCGIGYKLISAYAQQHNISPAWADENLDLVATAIAADIVPITGENRTLCILGLQQVNESPSVPIQALKKIGGLQKSFTITDLVFIIAPRVNAAGRMDDARKAVELFIADDLQKASELANALQIDNDERKDIDRHTTLEALELLNGSAGNSDLRSTVVYQPHWHKGVVGIVASRLIEHHYRPTVVLTLSNGKLTGSARSIRGFNLFEGLNQCAEYLENYGGHYFAAGLTLAEQHLDSFRRKFDDVVRSQVPDELFIPDIEIDAELNFSEINDSFLRILKQFAPHGPDNMNPVFISKGVKDYRGLSAIVKEKHLRMVLYQDGSRTMNGIGFNLAAKAELLKQKPSVDILYHIDENTWNGNTSVQLRILDIR